MIKKTHFLYILKNEFMPNIVKVGWSSRNPNIRADELGGVTGVPGKFELVKAFSVRDGLEAEEFVYRALSDLRVSKKEFIRLSPEEAAKRIKTILDKAGLILGTEENSLYFLVSHLIMMMDMLTNGERSAKEVNKSRLEEFMYKFLETDKFNSEIKLADYFWNEIRDIDAGKKTYLTDNDLLLLNYLRVSGYGAQLEKICSHHRFDFSDIYDLVFKSWIIKFLTIAKAGVKNEWPGVLLMKTRSLSTYREYYKEMMSDIHSFMIKSGVDWVPIQLEHESIDFNQIDLSAIKYGNILHAFGFKSGSARNEISEGQVTQLPDGRHKHYCIFNGIKYEVEWSDRLSINKSEFEDGKNWVYEWNKFRLKRCICIVLSQGRVLHVSGRESISPLTGSMIKIIGK